MAAMVPQVWGLSCSCCLSILTCPQSPPLHTAISSLQSLSPISPMQLLLPPTSLFCLPLTLPLRQQNLYKLQSGALSTALPQPCSSSLYGCYGSWGGVILHASGHNGDRACHCGAQPVGEWEAEAGRRLLVGVGNRGWGGWRSIGWKWGTEAGEKQNLGEKGSRGCRG